MATKYGEVGPQGEALGVAGCIVLGGAGAAWAGNAPPVSTMLRYHPTQDGVSISTPKPEEEAGCKVELVKGPTGGSGWALKDANGKTLRLLFSHDGKKPRRLVLLQGRRRGLPRVRDRRRRRPASPTSSAGSTPTA